MKLKLREASGLPVRLVCLDAAVRRDPGVSLRWVPGWRTLRAGSGGPRGALSPWHPWLPANSGASHACAVRQRGAGRGAAGFSCASLQSRGSKISTATFSLFQKRKRDVDFLLHRVCLPVFFPCISVLSILSCGNVTHPRAPPAPQILTTLNPKHAGETTDLELFTPELSGGGPASGHAPPTHRHQRRRHSGKGGVM